MKIEENIRHHTNEVEDDRDEVENDEDEDRILSTHFQFSDVSELCRFLSRREDPKSHRIGSPHNKDSLGPGEEKEEVA